MKMVTGHSLGVSPFSYNPLRVETEMTEVEKAKNQKVLDRLRGVLKPCKLLLAGNKPPWLYRGVPLSQVEKTTLAFGMSRIATMIENLTVIPQISFHVQFMCNCPTMLGLLSASKIATVNDLVHHPREDYRNLLFQAGSQSEVYQYHLWALAGKES